MVYVGPARSDRDGFVAAIFVYFSCVILLQKRAISVMIDKKRDTPDKKI